MMSKIESGLMMNCLERLQKEALACLEGFPSKVSDLNNIIEIYAPASITSGAETANRHPGPRSISSTIGEFDVTSSPEVKELDKNFDLASLSSYYSLTTYNDRGRSRHGISKRRYYRVRGGNQALRRRPAALGQLVALIASKLAVCTKNMVITPSWYFMERIISIFFHRRELKNAQCGPCADWSSSLSACATSLTLDNTTVGNFINAMRPVAVQLITDTTILKRWLQALATNVPVSCLELVNAIRNTETIDCWAYELFFHLKYLQVNRSREADKVVDKSPMSDEVTHMNLWHRMVQLRDNYIILYEILYADRKIQQMKTSK